MEKSRGLSVGTRDLENRRSARTSAASGTRICLPGALSSAQIVGSSLAVPLICNDVESYSLDHFDRAHTGAFNRTDMNEYVIVIVRRQNNAKALLAVEPLHPCSRSFLSQTAYARKLASAPLATVIQLCRFWRISETCVPRH